MDLCFYSKMMNKVVFSREFKKEKKANENSILQKKKEFLLETKNIRQNLQNIVKMAKKEKKEKIDDNKLIEKGLIEKKDRTFKNLESKKKQNKTNFMDQNNYDKAFYELEGYLKGKNDLLEQLKDKITFPHKYLDQNSKKYNIIFDENENHFEKRYTFQEKNPIEKVDEKQIKKK